MREIIDALTAAVDRGEPVALVTIVRATGSTPQRVGAKILVYPDGRTIGTVGGGCYENDAVLKARALLAEAGRPTLVRYDLNDDVAEETGLICGGQMEVFIEPMLPSAPLYILGAGHVGQQTARLAASVGFAVHVVDDREKFANRERVPEATNVTVAPIPEWIAATVFPPRSCVVVVTRGHKHDLDALRALLDRDVRYLGLIGSRAKIARLYEMLVAEGADAARLASVHAPIGLDIGAVSPEEIAISIVAELIAVRSGRLPSRDEAGGETSVRSMRWTPPTIRALV